LAGVEKGPDVQLEVRWRTVQSARQATLDLVGPTYLLDANFHFLDWNPAFDEIVAKPLRLARGSHAQDLIVALENRQEVVERAQKLFTADSIPLIDIEPLTLCTEKYGLIQFRKIASQIAEDTENGRRLVWCVTLNIDSVERPDELWSDIRRRLKDEANWSRYAVSYDQMLLRFPPYHQLLNEVTSLVGDSRYCADLGAGTGNCAKELLHGAYDRRVWAFESNEGMLQHLRAKLQDPDLSTRLTVFKGDIALSLREFPEAFFDAAVMVNVLYALDEPERCLEEIYRVLKPGGTLALSTSHSDTNVEKLFDAIRSSLRTRGLLDRLQSTVDDAQERHDEMRDKILRHTRQQVIELLTTAGFEVLERVDSSYEDAVMIVKAGKPCSIQPPQRERDQIFISYSHRDKAWLDQISKFLTPSVGATKVRAWDDTGIQAGEDWEAAINAAIARASVAVLLVSQDFLASEFIIKKELPSIMHAAAHEGLKIIWIPLSAGLYERQGLDRIQAAHNPNEPLETLPEPQQRGVLASIARKILALIPGNPS
jgi:ubiquinone/menaquinone biosynthesis C-methylase UbiE